MALAVLAGGEGRRMGFAKAEMRLHGRPILELLLEQFAWPGPTLLITAPGREHPTGWQRFTRELVDPSVGQGPLRGLLTALENLPTSTVVVAAVDMPFVRHEHLRWLVESLHLRPDIVGLMTRREAPEPLPSVYTTDAVLHARRLLESGRRSLHGLVDDHQFAAIDAPEGWPASTWTNLNSPEDLSSAVG